jgi:hypothetical protein
MQVNKKLADYVQDADGLTLRDSRNYKRPVSEIISCDWNFSQ